MLPLLVLYGLTVGALPHRDQQELKVYSLIASLLLIPGFLACGLCWGLMARRSLVWLLPVAAAAGFGFALLLWLDITFLGTVQAGRWFPMKIESPYWWGTGGFFGLICAVMGIVVIWRVRRAALIAQRRYFQNSDTPKPS